MSLKNVRFQKCMVLLWISLLFQTGSLLGQVSKPSKKVLFDLGHGGHDSGALGVDDLQEKDIVFQIGMELLQLNKLVLNDAFDIYLTRYEDRYVSLADRGLLAKTLQVDYVMSLHCNSAQTQAAGLEVYVHPKDSEPLGTSYILAEGILNACTALGFVNRGVKTANFQVLRDTYQTCPAILIELGFVTNPDEAAYLLKPHKLRALALCILMGLYQLNSLKP